MIVKTEGSFAALADQVARLGDPHLGFPALVLKKAKSLTEKPRMWRSSCLMFSVSSRGLVSRLLGQMLTCPATGRSVSGSWGTV